MVPQPFCLRIDLVGSRRGLNKVTRGRNRRVQEELGDSRTKHFNPDEDDLDEFKDELDESVVEGPDFV